MMTPASILFMTDSGLGMCTVSGFDALYQSQYLAYGFLLRMLIVASALLRHTLLYRDLAQFRAVAQELLSSPAWQLASQAAPQQLAAAAAEAASPVEVEEVLQALLAHAAALTATLKAALQLLEDSSKQEQASGDAAAAAAAAAGPEHLQAELDKLAAGVAVLRSAAAAARAPFGWEDGPLVVAMRRGQLLLVDELNLAEDAVLERLNRCGWTARGWG
jgi:midasin